MSIHREENVDSPKNFTDLLESIDAITENYKYPIIISTHPRTKKLEEMGYRKKQYLRFAKPFGFHEYNQLQLNAYCVISDSGTITEESSILKKFLRSLYAKHMKDQRAMMKELLL